MTAISRSKLTAKIIAFCLAVVSVLLFTESVTDPVNVTKLFALGGFAFAALGSIINPSFIQAFRNHRLTMFTVFFFMVVSVIVLFASEAPFSQSLYGVYGRNNGFLLYFSLSILLVSALSIVKVTHVNYSIYALIFVGMVNVAYGLWVIFFGDFIGWNNQYGNLLGTFGNPNFIGSFFGMFSSVLFSALASRKFSKKIRIASALLIPIVFLTILETKAVQGKVLFVVAACISIFFTIRDRFKSKSVLGIYVTLFALTSLTALLGVLQRGPLSGILYKETVSLRGQYWYAGWKTGFNNPLFGVGFDSFGDWYRRSRRESALQIPGVDTVTNTAHNVYMDIFAFGGWPLLFAYTLLTLITLISVIRFLKKQRDFDFVFVTLTSVWICYQLQSIISINQIGLAIWGWLVAGLIIAYEKLELDSGISKDKKVVKQSKEIKYVKSSSTTEIFSPKLLAGIGALLGLLISVPPLSADMKWRQAQLTQDVNSFEKILQPSYMNPLTSIKIDSVVGLFETSGFQDLAHNYALKAVSFNPNSFESWRNLSILSKTTEAERMRAYKMMKKLDPLNPNLGGTTK